MTPDEWLRVKRLVSDALAQPISERATYLTEHSPDEATRLEAESLLDAVLDSADRFEDPVLLINGRAAAFDVFEFMPSALGELVLRRPADDGGDDFAGTERYDVR